MPKKYTGPERRVNVDAAGNLRPTRRVGQERRIRDVRAGRTVSSMFSNDESGRILSDRATRRQLNTGMAINTNANPPYVGGAPVGVQDIVSVHETEVRPERRMGGAGRRRGDLARALRTGESVIFQAGKGPLKGALKKIARKAAKKAGPLGIALGVFGAAKEAKAMGSTIGSSTAYKGDRNILPPKPRIK